MNYRNGLALAKEEGGWIMSKLKHPTGGKLPSIDRAVIPQEIETFMKWYPFSERKRGNED
jgi:hypothetical protein